MSEVLAVLSGKGGTGKTSVCAGLATALAESGKRVLCIDCDVGLRNLDISLGMSEGSPLSFLDVASGHYSLSDAARHGSYPSLAFLTAPMNCTADDIDPEAFFRMLLDARREFDMILLDAPAGLGEGYRLAVCAADRCVVVTTQDASSLRDAQHTVMELRSFGPGRLHLVVNRVKKKLLHSMHATIDDAIDKAGLPLIGVVPEDDALPLALNRGVPLLLASRGGAAGAYRNIAIRLQGGHAPLLRIR